MQGLSNREFERYLDCKLYAYLQKLNEQNNTDVALSEKQMVEIVTLSKTIFYEDVNNRPLMSVKKSDFYAIAKSITKKIVRDTGIVQCISVNISAMEEDLLLVMMDIVDKFYINAPWVKTIILN